MAFSALLFEMKEHDLSLSSVGAVALSLLSGVILVAPGTVSAKPTKNGNDLDRQGRDRISNNDIQTSTAADGTTDEEAKSGTETGTE